MSSTRIRQALAAGELDAAANLLGSRYHMCGRVRRGEGLGRELGYPTANILLERGRSPLRGIFIVRVKGADDQVLDGVASVGTRPTVNGKQTLLEVFILDFESDLYGRHLEVEFITRLRDELRFESLAELKVNMQRDIERARACIARRSSLKHCD